MLKVKMFNSRSSDSLVGEINRFSMFHDVVNIQYSTSMDMIIGLQQNNAECRTIHYAMVTYNENIDKNGDGNNE